MSRHPATAAPPDSSAAGLPGRKKQPDPPSRYVGDYQCHTDGLLYRISHTDSTNAGLQMQRRRPDEPEWRDPYPVNTDPKRDDIHRLLSFGSFTRIES